MWKSLIPPLIALQFVVASMQSTNKSDCEILDVNDLQWKTGYINDPVDDTFRGNFKNFSIKNIQGIAINRTHDWKYFNTKVEMDKMLIFATKAFERFEVDEKNTENPEIKVILDFTCTVGRRHLTFHQPLRDINSYSPEFEQARYIYKLPTPLPGDFNLSPFGDPIIACDLDISNMRLRFSIIPAGHFYVYWGGSLNETNKCHKMLIKTIKPLKLTPNSNYLLIVTDTGTPQRKNIAELKTTINKKTSLSPNPYFESAYYTAIYDSINSNSHKLHLVEPIRVRKSTTRVECEIIERNYVNRIRIDCSTPNASISLLRSFPSDVWNNSVVLVTIQAKLVDGNSEQFGKTALEIYHMEEEDNSRSLSHGLSNGQCSCSSNTSNCHEFGSITGPFTLNYVKQKYVFTVEHCHIGYIGTIIAIAYPKEATASIQYFLQYEINFFKYDKRTGVLKKTDCSSAHVIYYLKLCARISGTKTSKCTRVVLHETASILDTVIDYTMLVRHISEEHEAIIPLLQFYRPLSCSIYEQYPPIASELFLCDTDFLYASAIDREMEEIANMGSPQFTLQLGLNPSDSSSLAINDAHFLEKRSLDFYNNHIQIPSKLYHDYNRVTITVVIDDINDNPPTFKAGTKLVIGYPIKEFVKEVEPPYLAKIVATDLDSAENASILYNIPSGEEYFYITSVTGKMYICLEAFENKTNLTLTVRASDRGGALDGLTTDLEVKIKLLSKYHILEMKIDNIMAEEADHVVEYLSDVSNLTVQYLTSTVIFYNISNNNITNLGRSYYTKILAYGLNFEDELINATDLERILKNIPRPSMRTSASFGNIQYTVYEEAVRKEKNKHYSQSIITGVIIILFLLVSSGAAGIYFYCKKNKLTK